MEQKVLLNLHDELCDAIDYLDSLQGRIYCKRDIDLNVKDKLSTIIYEAKEKIAFADAQVKTQIEL